MTTTQDEEQLMGRLDMKSHSNSCQRKSPDHQRSFENEV